MCWPTEWAVATLIPLYKKAGLANDPSNYRMLALMSSLPKVFEKILDKRMRKWSERVGALSDLQGGFRSGRATVDQIFITNEILTSKNRMQATYIYGLHRRRQGLRHSLEARAVAQIAPKWP